VSLLLTLLLAVVEPVAGPAAPPPPGAHDVAAVAGSSRRESIDPAAFLETLLERYRALQRYEDRTHVVQVTQRTGEAPKRVETRIGVAIADDGKLRIDTAFPRLMRGMGLGLPLRSSPAMRHGNLQYQLWLAPHMSLRFSEEPEVPRSGVPEGLTATQAEHVTIDEREMVHLELASEENEDGSHDATLDLYVNPESMLVERVTGQQRLPDGASYETTVDITPIEVVAEGPWTHTLDDEVGEVLTTPDGDAVDEPSRDGDTDVPGARPPLTRPPSRGESALR
jgi:hypothetical protein